MDHKKLIIVNRTELPLVSASLYVVDQDLQSPTLLKFLGFEAPVSIVTLANQLISFGRLNAASLNNGVQHLTASYLILTLYSRYVQLQ